MSTRCVSRRGCFHFQFHSLFPRWTLSHGFSQVSGAPSESGERSSFFREKSFFPEINKSAQFFEGRLEGYVLVSVFTGLVNIW